MGARTVSIRGDYISRGCSGTPPPQRDDALEVPRLREEVEGLHRGQDVAGGEEVPQVAHLRGRVAGDVDDAARAEGEELGEERRVAALARRVDDDDGVGRREVRVRRLLSENCARSIRSQNALRNRSVSGLKFLFGKLPLRKRRELVNARL